MFQKLLHFRLLLQPPQPTGLSKPLLERGLAPLRAVVQPALKEARTQPDSLPGAACPSNFVFTSAGLVGHVPQL